MMHSVVVDYVGKLDSVDRGELEASVKLWCQCTGGPHDPDSYGEFLKPASFGAVWAWSLSLQRRLLQWEWHLVRTTRDQPFVTSDRPVLMHWDRDQGTRLVSMPASSEVALVIIDGGRFNEARDRTREAYAMNLGSMDRATEFVVACKQSFPGDDTLMKRVAGAPASAMGNERSG